MANQNLSQFGEKLFVADADHTFIWDTAASISKRVSRNSWLNSGTLTSDAPVTISQTWSNAAVAFTGLKVDAAGTSGTNSASTSLLLDLQMGGGSKFKVDKNGLASVPDSAGTGGFVFRPGNTGSGGIGYLSGGNYGIWAGNGAAIGFSTGAALVGNIQTALYTEGAGQLALRNGAAAQTFNVYGTWTTAITNFERLAIKYNATDVAYQIAAEKGTTNGDYRPLQLWTGGASRLHITTAGNVGIGTTSPTFRLSVQGDTECRGRLYVTQSSPATALVFDSTTSTHKIYAEATQNIAFQTVGVGNVGIGTNAPTSKLHVSAGDVEVDTIAKGVILKSPDNTRYRVTVANGGTLSVAAV